MKNVYNYFNDKTKFQKNRKSNEEILNIINIIGKKEELDVILEKNYIFRICSEDFTDVTDKIFEEIDNFVLK